MDELAPSEDSRAPIQPINEVPEVAEDGPQSSQVPTVSGAPELINSVPGVTDTTEVATPAPAAPDLITSTPWAASASQSEPNSQITHGDIISIPADQFKGDPSRTLGHPTNPTTAIFGGNTSPSGPTSESNPGSFSSETPTPASQGPSSGGSGSETTTTSPHDRYTVPPTSPPTLPPAPNKAPDPGLNPGENPFPTPQ